MSRDKLAQVWGQHSAAFYAEHLHPVVNIAVSTSKVFKGTRSGVAQYDLPCVRRAPLRVWHFVKSEGQP